MVFGEIDEDGFYYVSALLCDGFEQLSIQMLTVFRIQKPNQDLRGEGYVYLE